jgi:hypothetical protein
VMAERSRPSSKTASTSVQEKRAAKASETPTIVLVVAPQNFIPCKSLQFGCDFSLKIFA